MTDEEREDVEDAFCCREVTFLSGGYENRWSLKRFFEYEGKKYEVIAKKSGKPDYVYEKLEIKELTV